MALPAKADFLGRGWSFPPSFSKWGDTVSLVDDVEDIRQSLRILLNTSPGERVMLPGYGCDLWRFLFRDLTTSLITELRDAVSTAIIRWEPRIDLLALLVTADEGQPGLVNIEVDFRVRRTNSRSNIVYPFYLTEATLAGGS
jgi:phage baseplate assembly protein W